MSKKLVNSIVKPTTQIVDVKVKTVMESVIQLIKDKHLS
jgi:hypothetical protein